MTAAERIYRNPHVTYRRLEEGAGAVLLNVETGEYRHLNETAALLWMLLDPAPTREEFLARVRAAVTDPPPTLATEVDTFLESLEARVLIRRAARPAGNDVG